MAKVNWDKLKTNTKKYIENLTVSEIVSILETASDYYYNKGKSLIPDEVFDFIVDSLKERDPNNSFLNQVGYPLTEGKKVKLPLPMPSLNKIKDDNANTWLEKNKTPNGFMVTDKLDGVSVLLVGTRNRWKLYTRGDGLTGGDVSFLVPYLNLPKPIKGVIIRCEAIISKSNFRKFEKDFKNPRNFVAGLFSPNRKDVNKKAVKQVDIVAYDMLKPRVSPSKAFKLLKEKGFKVVPYKLFKELTQKVLKEYLLNRKEKSKYEIDGLVVTINKKNKIPSSNPSFSVAYKTLTQDQVAVVKVRKVHWNISKHGYLKPRIEIEPVTLKGVTIQFLTGFNALFIQENNIGKGAKLKIVRSGDVIPHILEVVKQSKKPDMPKKLNYKWTKTGVDIVAFDRQVKDDLKVKRITHFFRTLGVEGVSEKIFKKLYDNGFTSIPKLLDAKPEDFLKLEGVKQKLANNIYNALQSVVKQPLDLSLFMYATGCFGRDLGYNRLKLINDKIPNLLFLNENKINKKELYNKVIEIDGFSDKLTKKFVKKLPVFLRFYNKTLKKYFYSFSDKKQQVKEGKLKNISVCFSGFRDKEMEKFILDNGGDVKNSVNKKLSFLVVKDKTKETSKMKKAKDLGIEILTKEEFMDFIAKKHLKSS